MTDNFETAKTDLTQMLDNLVDHIRSMLGDIARDTSWPGSRCGSVYAALIEHADFIRAGIEASATAEELDEIGEQIEQAADIYTRAMCVVRVLPHQLAN